MSIVLDREEYVEQAYFFRTFRERVAHNLPTQDVLASLDQEILTTTRLPMAVQFLATEIKHSGILATGFEDARVLDLRGQKLDGHRQPGGGQNLLVETGEDVLGRQVVGDPLAERAEEVRLLDVLLPVEDGGHGVHSTVRGRSPPVCR